MIVDEIEQALSQGIKEIHFFDDLFAEVKMKLLKCVKLFQKEMLSLIGSFLKV